MSRLWRFAIIAVLCTVATPRTSLAVDPTDTEFLLEEIGVASAIDTVMRQINTTCLACGLPSVGASDVTSEVVAVAIGQIAPYNDTPVPNPAFPNVLALCQPYLLEFLANTEYLGPLVDYQACLQANVPAAVTSQIPVVSAGVQFLAGTCTFSTTAGYRAITNSTDFSGITDCRLGDADVLGAYITQVTSLWDFLYDTQQAAASSSVAAPGFVKQTGSKPGRITSTAKVRVRSSVTPAATSWCPSGATCTLQWLILPNKNVDTASRPACVQAGLTLECQANSIPLTANTIYRY